MPGAIAGACPGRTKLLEQVEGLGGILASGMDRGADSTGDK